MVSVQNPDGSVIVEHADGTRISSLLQERPMNANPHCLLRTGDRQAHSTLIKSILSSRPALTDDYTNICAIYAVYMLSPLKYIIISKQIFISDLCSCVIYFSRTAARERNP